MRAICTAVLLLSVGLSAAKAQENAAAPASTFVLNSPISGAPIPIEEFSSTGPYLPLEPKEPGARTGRVWFRTAYGGLFIAGTVDGPQPDFARSREEIRRKDHVEIWFSGVRKLDLPVIGWGNQFGDGALPNGAASCDDLAKEQANRPDIEKVTQQCKQWAAKQAEYRPYLKRLFLRDWVMAPDLAEEESATPAYEEIQKRFSDLGDPIPELMKPRGKPRMYLFPRPTGYAFEVVIDRDALPPLPTLQSNELYARVDVYSAASQEKQTGVYSSSSESGIGGDPQTFNTLRLQAPMLFQLTPCEMELAGTDKRGDSHPAWFIAEDRLGPEPYESEAFILVNDPAGYRYDPAGLSPTVRVTHFFWKSAGENDWVCGPPLTYRKGGQAFTFTEEIAPEGFDTKRMPDGHLLIKTGPRVWYSEFGSGQCGACPRSELRVFDLNPEGKLSTVLGLGDVLNAPELVSQDMTISPDWSQVTEYDLRADESGGSGDEEQPESWTATTWCLKKKGEGEAYAYEKCGEKRKVHPPNPPVLKELRDYPG